MLSNLVFLRLSEITEASIQSFKGYAKSENLLFRHSKADQYRRLVKSVTLRLFNIGKVFYQAFIERLSKEKEFFNQAFKYRPISVKLLIGLLKSVK